MMFNKKVIRLEKEVRLLRKQFSASQKGWQAKLRKEQRKFRKEFSLYKKEMHKELQKLQRRSCGSKKNSNTIYTKKSELDQFYTSPKIAEYCFNTVKEKCHLDDFSLILEPCAGTGSFYSLFPLEKRMGLDLDPKIDGIDKQDFFKFVPPNDEKIITITNPPFGHNASLAIKFFNTAASFSKVIAFIVPKSFKKQSVQNKLDLNFHLLHSEDLPKNSFVLDGQPYDVPCCFQIWEKRTVKREKKIIKLDNDVFEFVTKNEADFAVRRVGGRTGKSQPNLKKAAVVSHYFLKLKDPSLRKEELMKFIDELDVSSIITSTAGVKSLSKQEFVEAFFKFYKRI